MGLSVVGITGTIYRGTERISSSVLLDLLEVGPDPVIRQKVAKRSLKLQPPSLRQGFPQVARGPLSRVLTASVTHCNI
jgi:hypothetical protein